MAYKTPGVQLQEIVTFPPSVAAAPTAIPAFVGYTQRAVGADGEDLTLAPTRVQSLLEFEAGFGGAFAPDGYDVVLDTADGNAVGAVSPTDAADNVRRYYLYPCLRQFYANGGGACWIVSVGSYSDAPVLGSDSSGLQGGLRRLERLDEPTLLVLPDGVSLSAAELGSLQVAALRQCGKLKDRFLIADLRQGDRAAVTGNDPVELFRTAVGSERLKYGAAYYPWLRSIYRPEVRFRQLRLVDTDTPPVAIPSATLDTLTDDPDTDALVPAVRDADTDVAELVDAVDTGAIADLDLDRGNLADLPAHFARLAQRLAQTTPTPVATVRERFGRLLALPRAIALAFPALQALDLSEELTGALSSLGEDPELVSAIVTLIALEKNEDVRSSVSTTRETTHVDSDYAALNDTVWIGEHDSVTDIEADTVDFGEFGGTNQRATALNASRALRQPFDVLAGALLTLFERAEFLADAAEGRLFERHPVYRGIAEEVKRSISLVPACGAVAGVYAAVDRTRGVWKAPANVSLADTVGPAVKLDDRGQASLNVHPTGKSINAIRAFAGKGTLIWGARTLAGNDNEWRYIPVRRFFNMAEESIQKATEPFVFEPNDANTWVRVRAMIENFLTVQWRHGALAGAVPAQAFFVKVGLGETMTAEDILEGRMLIEVGMAAVRPAEFIVLKFAHRMQAS